MNKEIKITLKAARINNGLTQAQVAEKIGVSASSIYDIESGRTDPRFSTVRKLADLYGLPLDNISVHKKFA